MKKAISLHVGLNRVNPANFPNTALLKGCEKDAEAMAGIAAMRGFSVRQPLLNENATLDKVVGEIKAAAKELEPGGIFLFTFAGHGTRLKDKELEEADGKDEASLLYDLLLLDDVWERDLLPRFAKGARVVVVADSCHSGTSTDLFSVRHETFRTISEETRLWHLEKHRDCYNDILRSLPKAPVTEATGLLLAACEDSGKTGDRPDNGVFTSALLKVWNDGAFPGNYKEFRDAIKQRLSLENPFQVPQLRPTGAKLNPEFKFTKPIFTI